MDKGETKEEERGQEWVVGVPIIAGSAAKQNSVFKSVPCDAAVKQQSLSHLFDLNPRFPVSLHPFTTVKPTIRSHLPAQHCLVSIRHSFSTHPIPAFPCPFHCHIRATHMNRMHCDNISPTASRGSPCTARALHATF